VSELEQHEPSCAIYICATKLDLIQSNKDRVVDYHNTTDYVDEVSGNLFETSSKTGLNVCELFDQIARDYMHNKANHLQSFDEFSLGVRAESARSCCNWYKTSGFKRALICKKRIACYRTLRKLWSVSFEGYKLQIPINKELWKKNLIAFSQQKTVLNRLKHCYA